MNKKKILKFLQKNLDEYEIIYITSDLRGFLFNKIFTRADELISFFLKYFIKHNKTVIIPTFTYTKKGKFFVDSTISKLSYLSKWVLKQKKILRSAHPIFSTSALGPKYAITENIGKSAFGKNSIYERMYKEKSCLLHIGRPFEMGNTIIHFVEQIVRAPYRYEKKFNTKVYLNKKKFIGSKYSAFVKKKEIKNTNTNTIKIAKILRKKKLLKEIGSINKLTNITILDYKMCINNMLKEYKKDKNIFLD